ncbi:hypothetical protein H1R17_03170 [Flavobacterium sp. xlx-214]|uniref:hypothetical protein n=1 Tax=unclassified Flavobacterium TaxID=196869 RepID=UPI0013D6497D|nr:MULTISPECIES: hypothetical protein [unclassified Flavobacterium]MBA5793286.1 hypothetical protein [Flavobacterium sp. xlx-221]QMI84149.1 hypothetical protein H1R17_03170 [Flavobacterium sp. xlx-214]
MEKENFKREVFTKLNEIYAITEASIYTYAGLDFISKRLELFTNFFDSKIFKDVIENFEKRCTTDEDKIVLTELHKDFYLKKMTTIYSI